MRTLKQAHEPWDKFGSPSKGNDELAILHVLKGLTSYKSLPMVLYFIRHLSAIMRIPFILSTSDADLSHSRGILRLSLNY